MPLLEREEQLDQLTAVVTAASEGDGSVAVLPGEAGLGKSALLAAAAAGARTEGVIVLAARGAELERDFAYGLARQLLERTVVAAPERDELLGGAARLAAPVLGIEGSLAASGPDASFAAQHGLYWVVANLAARAPVLLCVDDAHWADRESLRWLAYTARRLEGLRLAMVVAWRAGEEADAAEPLRAIEESARRVALEPLSSAAVGTLVRAHTRDDPDSFCAACHEATGGNPFLVAELAHALATGDIQPTAEHAFLVGQLSIEAVARSVLVRISRLGESAIRLGRAVAILDSDAELRFAAAVADLDLETAAHAAAALVEAHVFARGEMLAYAHPLLRAAVYADLPDSARAAAHRRAAEALRQDASLVDRAAVHLLSVPPDGDPRVAETLRVAATRAIGRGAPEAAARLLERGLREPPPDDAIADMRFEYGQALGLAGDVKAVPELRAALEAQSEGTRRARVAAVLARLLWGVGELKDTVDVLERELPALPPGSMAQRLELELASYEISFEERPYPAIARRLERLAADADPAGPEHLSAELLLSFMGIFGVYDAAGGNWLDLLRARAPEARRLLLELGESHLPAYYLAIGMRQVGEVHAALDLLDLAVDRARSSANRFMLGLACGLRALVLQTHGDLAAAEADARTAVQMRAESGLALLTVFSVGALVSTLVMRGELDEAAAVLEEQGLMDAPMPPVVQLLTLTYARALFRLASGDAEGALRDFESIDAACRARAGDMPAYARAGHTLARFLSGDLEGARAQARAQVAACEGRDDHSMAHAERALGLVLDGDEGIAFLQSALARFEAGESPLHQAMTLVDLGAALRRANRRREAREILARALDLAHRCGAGLTVRQAQAELRATGARPRRLVLSGADSLTASERRVAELAAKGLGNRQIAQMLFVTRGTIETHLSQAYAKLGIKRRTELAAALAPRQPARQEESVPVLAALLAVVTTRPEVVHELVQDHAGRDTAQRGDCTLALFEGPTTALAAAADLREAAAKLGLEIRAALHVGEVRVTDGDIRGAPADLVQRFARRARPGEVLVSSVIGSLVPDASLSPPASTAAQADGLLLLAGASE